MECEVVDIWTDHAAWPLNKFVPWYQFLARNPLLWRALWCSNRPLPTAIEMTNAVNFSRFRSCIEEHSPDLVVSVHPLCQHLPLRVLRQMAASAGAASAESAGDAASFEDTADVEGALLSPIPFATVVTDLGGAHPM
jgi:1,2-diacylglycerol 3-beta-galactosyltransferase